MLASPCGGHTESDVSIERLMMTRIVILGGGTGGTIMANRLRRIYGPEAAEIVVIDRDDVHVYQPGLLFVPFGLAEPGEIVRSRRAQLRPGIEFRQAEIADVDVQAEVVNLGDGEALGYDVLIIASGSRLIPEETEGMTGPGWGENVFTFFDRAGAAGLAGALRRFDGGRVVVNMVDLPIKCPVAPLEFAFLADWSVPGARPSQRHRADIRDASGRRIHQAGRRSTPRRAARAKADRAGHRVRHRGGRWQRRTPGQLRRAGGAVRPARHHPAPRRSVVRRSLQPVWATSSDSFPPTPTRSSRRSHPTCSRSGMPPTSRHPRPGR